jgi:hypothetical protein
MSKIANAIKTWLEAQDDQNQILMVTGMKSFTAKELIYEIENQTETGVKLEESITQLTIDLLFRKRESI